MSSLPAKSAPPFRDGLKNIPPYKPAKSLEAIKQERGLEQVVRLSANENALGFSPKVELAIQQAVKEGINFYPDSTCLKLRFKLADLIQVQPEQLIFGNGSFELLSLIAQTYMNTGEEAIVPEPSFGWYKVATWAMGGVVVPVPLKEHRIDLGEIKRQIHSLTRLIWLCNPNNPTGTFFTGRELESFLRDIPPHVVVVLDEAYYEYANRKNEPDTVKLLEEYGNVILLRTFSKIYGLAGLRIGYGMANEEVIHVLNRIRPPINVNQLAQVAALASLDDREFVALCLENNRQEKQYLYETLQQLSLEIIPTETNFIMVDLGKDSETVVGNLLQQGISVRGGREFGMPTWLRVTIGRPEQNREFVKLLQQALEGI